MKHIAQIAIFCLFCAGVVAQNPQNPSNQDLREQMLQMQRLLREQMEHLSPGGSDAWQFDTTFQFNMDSLFDGGGFSRQFFFSPFGGSMEPDSLGSNPFGDMFDLFFGRGPNDENSALDDSNNDGLLPEERLREEESPEKRKQESEKPVAPEQKKPKIKTIRI